MRSSHRDRPLGPTEGRRRFFPFHYLTGRRWDISSFKVEQGAVEVRLDRRPRELADFLSMKRWLRPSFDAEVCGPSSHDVFTIAMAAALVGASFLALRFHVV